MAKNEKRSLQDIFEDARNAQKGQEGKILDEVYTRYLPAINANMSEICCTFGLMEQEVMDIYGETISYMCDHVINGLINVKDFKLILKECLTSRFEQHTNAESEMTPLSIEGDMRDVEQIGKLKARDENWIRESLLFTIQFLSKLAKDDRLARQHGITCEHVKAYMDHLGINDAHRPFSVAELAIKYNQSESRMKAMLAVTAGSVRKSSELEDIRTGL